LFFGRLGERTAQVVLALKRTRCRGKEGTRLL
jgi:hypothetical protein